MPDITITVSTGTLTRIQAAGLAAGYVTGPSYLRAIVRAAVIAYEQGNAATNAANASNVAVAADFASTST